MGSGGDGDTWLAPVSSAAKAPDPGIPKVNAAAANKTKVAVFITFSFPLVHFQLCTGAPERHPWDSILT